MAQCQRIGCENNRYDFDSLFCPECRDEWRLVCKTQGILDIPVPHEDVYPLLHEFMVGNIWVEF